jgi:hypothetical protein
MCFGGCVLAKTPTKKMPQTQMDKFYKPSESKGKSPKTQTFHPSSKVLKQRTLDGQILQQDPMDEISFHIIPSKFSICIRNTNTTV